jgi:hypothetical protein
VSHHAPAGASNASPRLTNLYRPPLLDLPPNPLPAGASIDEMQMAYFSTGYFQTVAAAAGLTISRTEQDADRLAIDAFVQYDEGTVAVQLKSTCTLTFNQDGRIRFPVKQDWRDKWNKRKQDVFIVLLVIEPSSDSWIWHMSSARHTDSIPGSAILRGAAYWARWRVGTDIKSVFFDRQNRIDTGTFEDWRQEYFLSAFGAA